MENKSKLNTVLLVIIIILLVIGLGYYFLRDSKEKENNILVNNIPQENQKNLLSDNQVDNNLTQIKWVKSPKLGLYYPSNFNSPTESYRVIDSKNPKYLSTVDEPLTNSIPVFSLVFNDGKAVITWGDVWKGGILPGTCTELEFGVFEYGVSSTACVKGYRTWIAHFSARETVTKEDLKIFGDFVLKNKEESINNSTTYTYNNHGFTIELPKGFTPTETRSENGPSYSISMPIGDLVYVTDSSFWEKYNIPSYTYKEEKKVGETIFKVYEYSGATFFWYKKGDVGYQFGAVNKTGLENLLKTFKFVGWN